MSTAALIWSSSPVMLGRPSSPLNPHSSHTGGSMAMASSSSPPASSPTPQHHAQLPSFSLSLGSPPIRHRHSTGGPSTLPLRYQKPHNPNVPLKRSSHSGPQTPSRGGSGDFFAEGTTPVESAMWQERFVRRVKDRERRKKAREDDLNRRRSMSRDKSDGNGEAMDDDEADRQAQEDDEEIFRRLMILQKRRANHQSLVSYEVETGGSDPLLPEFWEEELDRMNSGITVEDRERMDLTPTRTYTNTVQPPFGSLSIQLDEEAEWARQAAEAEEAEREMEELEVARRVEEAYGVTVPSMGNTEADMDWEAFDAMDIE